LITKTPTNNTVLIPKLGNLQLLRAADVAQAWGLNILLYGQSGSGKTTLASTAQDSPHGRDVLFIDVEGGTRSISDRADIAVYKPMRWEDLKEVYQALNAGGHTFKTVVVDSLSDVQTLALKSVVGDVGTPDQRSWGATNEKLIGFVRALKNLAYSQQVNSVFTALVREEKDENGVLVSRPAMTPGSALNVCAAVDNVGYLTKNDKGERILHLEGTKHFIAKTREPMTNRKLPAKFANPTLVDVLAALRAANEEAAA
jgi:phage nucleotide-binding protein